MCFDVNFLNQAKRETIKVFCTETGALTKGYALCYDRDYGTASASDESRVQRAQLPDATNNQWFAGVLVDSYPANPSGQWVEIAPPGEVAEVYVNAAATINNAGVFVFDQSSGNTGSTSTLTKGQFSAAYGLRGRGGVQFLQTTSGAGLVTAMLLDGEQTGGVEQITCPAATNPSACSPFGVTSITTAAGNNTTFPATMANGTFIGQRKYFHVTAVSTACFINFGAGKVQSLAGGAASANISVGAAGYFSLKWNGTLWTIDSGIVSTLTLS